MKYNFEDFTLVNEKMRGFLYNEMVIIASRPDYVAKAMGMNIAKRAFLGRIQIPTLIFAFGSSASIYEKLMDSAGLELHLLSDDFISQESILSAGKFDGAPFWIDDKKGISISEMRATARKLNHKLDGKLGLIVIYDLKDILVSAFSSSIEQEREQILRDIKAMSKEFLVPVVVLAGMERKYNVNEGLPYLYQSELIEKNADAILLLNDRGERNKEGSYKVNVNVAKNSTGPTESFTLLLDKTRTHFSKYVEEAPNKSASIEMKCDNMPLSETKECLVKDKISQSVEEKKYDEYSQGRDYEDSIIYKAIQIIKLNKSAKASLLQRKLKIGSIKADRIISELEKEGLISSADNLGNRKIFF